MRRHFIESIDLYQAILLPECFDDYLKENVVVRVLDAFFERLDLAELGFSASSTPTGRPGFYTAVSLVRFFSGIPK